MSAIEIRNVSVTLNKQVTILQNLTAKISENKITGIIDPSGAGKTTLLRAIVGSILPTNGDIIVFDQPSGSSNLRTKVSYMTQHSSIYDDLTVAQNIQYFANMMNINNNKLKKTVKDIIGTVNLQDKSNTLVSQLSGGQRQRVSLAIALIGNPSLLILDEPTVGLDPVLREQLWSLFRSLADRGTTIVISSHVMDEAERCDELMLMRDGSILIHNTPNKICEQTNTTNIEESFLKLVGKAEA